MKPPSYICPLTPEYVEQWNEHVRPELLNHNIAGADWDWDVFLNWESYGWHCFCLVLDEERRIIPNGMVAISTSHDESIYESGSLRKIIKVEYLAASHESFLYKGTSKKYKHVGSALLDRVLLLTKELDGVVRGKMTLDAIPEAVEFYKKYGMENIGSFDGWNYRMELAEAVGKSKLNKLFRGCTWRL